ncbi:hypothetical protein Tco_0969514 [Tanacetum coccineum]
MFNVSPDTYRCNIEMFTGGVDLQHLQAILQDLQHLKAISGTSRNASAQTASTCFEYNGNYTAIVEMYIFPKHTVNSAALLHEVYNDMGKPDLE